jgi:hypothetical protein
MNLSISGCSIGGAGRSNFADRAHYILLFNTRAIWDILNTFLGDFFSFCSYNIQHCFICRPSDSTVPTDAGIEPRTVATCALAVRRSNH